jgi:pyridoxamine 5'-phosphate oxidase
MPDRNHRELGDLRREYDREQLNEAGLPADPLVLFNSWLEEAVRSDNPDPTAMTLSTVDRQGAPSSRMVLLKKIHGHKLVFFTSYRSRKAREIQRNPRVAVHFFWPQQERQVKITGSAEVLDDESADHYFNSRPFESQVAAWASSQSEVIPDRDHLEREFQHYLQKFEVSGKVPRPSTWGAYAITPRRMEFWQGGRFRLHDRIEYTLQEEAWNMVRLAP